MEPSDDQPDQSINHVPELIRLETKTVYWEGPLPHPQILIEYEKAVPGLAAKLAEEFSAEAQHRRDFENSALRESIKVDILGRISALIFALTALGVAGYCAFLGHPAAAIAIGGVTIATVVGAFIWGRQKGEE